MGDTYIKYSIVHYGRLAYHQPAETHSTCKLAVSLPNGRTISLWKETLGNMEVGILLPNPTPKELFEFVKAAFEEQKKIIFHAEFSSKYIEHLWMGPLRFRRIRRAGYIPVEISFM